MRLDRQSFALVRLSLGPYAPQEQTIGRVPAIYDGLSLVASEQETCVAKRDTVLPAVLTYCRKKALLRVPYVLEMPYAGS